MRRGVQSAPPTRQRNGQGARSVGRPALAPTRLKPAPPTLAGPQHITPAAASIPPQALDAAAAALPPARLAAARDAYAALQAGALRAVADLADLQARMRGLVAQLSIQAEAAGTGLADPVQLVDRWREGRDAAKREVGSSAPSVDGEGWLHASHCWPFTCNRH